LKLNSIKNFHPVLFGIFFVFSLFAFNIDLVLLHGYTELLTLILVVGGLAFLLWWGLSFILKNKQKAGFLASLALVMVFAYGHVISMVDEFFIEEFYFLIFWIGIFTASFYGILKIKKESQNITTILFFVSLSLIALPLVDVVEYQQSLSSYEVGDTDMIVKTVIPLDKTVKSLDTKPPNIYYLIFDRYPASKVLSELYDYDNSDFFNYLESKGFYIAHDSMANYPFTFLSMASTKNMKYVNYLSEIAGDSNNRAIAYELDKFCEVCQFLQSQGYQYVYAPSFFQPTATNVDIDDPTDDVFVIPDFTALFYETTMISHVANLISGVVPTGILDSREDARKEKYQTILQKFNWLEKIPDSDQPVYIYSHMLIPHPSYVFDDEGNYISYEESLKFSEKKLFRDQLTFLNKKIKNLVDKLLTESEQPPIILIQSDEGPYPYRTRTVGAMNYNFGSMPFEELETKIRIFNAYYLPDSDKKELYPSISPVNSFRVVFNEYFDTNLEILPDYYYVYSDRDHYYNFVNVTEKILDPSIHVIDLDYNIDGQFDWKKIGVESDEVDNFSYISDVLTIYYQREDLQEAYPEVAEGNLRHLLGWAGEYGLTFYPHLEKHDYIYELMQIYDKKRLNRHYPEVLTESDLSRIFVWAVKSGMPIYEKLEKHLPIYDLMIVYSKNIELQNSYPEAANGNNLSNLFCWAEKFGAEEYSTLTLHKQLYSEKCLKLIDVGS